MDSADLRIFEAVARLGGLLPYAVRVGHLLEDARRAVKDDGTPEGLLTISALAWPARQGRAEFLSLWAGQGLRLARRQSAGDLVARLAKEIQTAVARLKAP